MKEEENDLEGMWLEGLQPLVDEGGHHSKYLSQEIMAIWELLNVVRRPLSKTVMLHALEAANRLLTYMKVFAVLEGDKLIIQSCQDKLRDLVSRIKVLKED